MIDSSFSKTKKKNKQIVIVGGRLQGSEAAYLGREAGMEIILIDSDSLAPAQKLCSRFICGDVLGDNTEVQAVLERADMILPTLENYDVLCGLVRLCEKRGYRLAFDLDAYGVTSSKTASNKLFESINLPFPKYWPNGSLPYIAKPDSNSGSHGVKLFGAGLEEFVKSSDADNYIVQEFINGPSYSVEIIGEPGNYRVYEPTQIFVDAGYDCNIAAVNRVLAEEKKAVLGSWAVKIAGRLKLKGIMDMEVIDTGVDFDGKQHSDRGIKILEIDARLPSQTAVAVYHATGMNYIKELYALFVDGDFTDPQVDRGLCATYRQYLVRQGEDPAVRCLGEHILVEGGLLESDGELSFTETGKNRGSRAVTDRIWSKENGAGEWRGFFVNWAGDMKMLDEEVKKWSHIL